MSSKAHSHYQRYQHNAAFAVRLESALPGDRDWCCVAMFYAALHLLDAYLATKSFAFPIDSHPNQTHHADAKANLTKLAAVLDSKVMKLLGIK